MNVPLYNIKIDKEMHALRRKYRVKGTYFFVTIFLPFTNFVDVEVDLKFPPPPPPPPPPNDPPNDELENDEKLKHKLKDTIFIYYDFFAI